MKEKVALIIGEKGQIRDGVKALVEAIPEISRVVCFDDVPSWSDRIIKLEPDLIIIYPSKLEELKECCRAFFNWLERSSPFTKVLALVDKVNQRQLFLESGADAVLVRGFRGDSLIRTVRSLIL